ncbi:cytochrome P450 [Aspergillus spectabilis]
MSILDASDGAFNCESLEIFDLAAHIIIDMTFAPSSSRIKFFLPGPILNTLDQNLHKLLNSLLQWAQGCLYYFYASSSISKDPQYPVIFSSLPDLSDRSKKAQAVDILAAGSDTTAITLTFALYHILANPRVRDNLATELKQAWPDVEKQPSSLDLEKLPYLTACRKE